MSLKLNSSGGGSITLQEPSTASNRTLTLPDNTGNLISSADSGTVSQAMLASGVAGNGPAFSAYNNGSQNVSAGVATKITFDTEEYDTANCFASSRFTPTVAGYYFLNCAVRLNSGTFSNDSYIEAYKNGSLYRRLIAVSPGVGSLELNCSALIYFNGTTDYVEMYILANGSGTINIGYGSGIAFTNYFSGFLARAA